MTTGAGVAEDPSGPRLTAELMRMNRSIGELLSSQKSTAEKVNEVHKAMFIGNGHLSVIQWLLKHDNQISRALGRTDIDRRKSFKTIGYSGLGSVSLLTAFKLCYYLVTGHWPTIP